MGISSCTEDTGTLRITVFIVAVVIPGERGQEYKYQTVHRVRRREPKRTGIGPEQGRAMHHAGRFEACLFFKLSYRSCFSTLIAVDKTCQSQSVS